MTCACVGHAWLQVTSGAGRKLPFSAMQAVAPGADLPSDRVVSVQDAAAASFSPSRRRRGSQEGNDAVGPEDAVSAAAAAAAERVRAYSHTSTASLAAELGLVCLLRLHCSARAANPVCCLRGEGFHVCVHRRLFMGGACSPQWRRRRSVWTRRTAVSR